MCRSLGNPQHFQILNFNVEGLKSKLDNPSFLELIQKYDIIILTETWKANTLKINIEGFWDYSQVCSKHKNAIRHSGGIAVLAKNHIRFGLNLVEDTERFLCFGWRMTSFFVEPICLPITPLLPLLQKKTIFEN